MVDGVEIPVNTNHIEREWRELRKVLEHHKEDQFPGLIQKEIFRIMFIAGRPEEEWPFIFLKKMGGVRNKSVLFLFFEPETNGFYFIKRNQRPKWKFGISLMTWHGRSRRIV